MEFLVVSPTKLKIMLTREDMIKYEIDGDNIDYDNPRVRRSFWRILDVAKEKCGFESSGDKILIQFYPSRDGSEIFVTKLGLISSGAERTIAKSSRVAMLRSRSAVYSFPSFSSLLSATRSIKDSSYESEPRAYFDEKGNYYIILEERTAAHEKSHDVSPLIEFGRELPQILVGYVAEHSSPIDFALLSRLAKS